MISWPPLVPYKKLTHSRYSVLDVAVVPSSPLFCSTFVIMRGGLFDLGAEEVNDKSLKTLFLFNKATAFQAWKILRVLIDISKSFYPRKKNRST